MSKVFGILILFFLLVSCAADSSEIINYFADNDGKAPVLLEVSAVDDNKMKIVFDEDVFEFGHYFDDYSVVFDGCNLYIKLPQTLKAGQVMTVSGRVRDKAGNTTGFSTPVWGYNPTPADILINEFTLTSSEKQPQRTELYVRNGGLLSGLCLYGGSPDYFDSRVVLPDLRVNAGTYIVVWWVSKTVFKTFFPTSESTVFTVNNTINICADLENKLSASNGVICLALSPSPGARLLDCVVYSKKTATKCNGFGSDENLAKAQYVYDNKQWEFEEVDASYAVNVSNSTSTRSVSRREFSDTNSAFDWYVTVTSGFTFGCENTSAEYKEED